MHARRWARQREKQNYLGSVEDICIVEIDTSKLPRSTYVFSTRSLVPKLDILHPHVEHEFLFLHRIPGNAVVCKQSLGEMEEKGMSSVDACGLDL